MLQNFWATLQAKLANNPNTLTLLHNHLVQVLFIVLALVLVVPSNVWSRSGFVVTLVHEFGHAIAATLVFQKVRGIRINFDQSGDTHYLSDGFLPFRIWVSWWGYAAAPGLGLLYIYTLMNGFFGISLTVTVLIACLMLIHIRNFLAFACMVSFAVVMVLMWLFVPSQYTAVIIYSFAWFLLFGGLKSCFNLLRAHLQNQGSSSDASALRGLTLIPAYVWVGLFITWSVFCLVFAGKVLLVTLS